MKASTRIVIVYLLALFIIVNALYIYAGIYHRDTDPYFSGSSLSVLRLEKNIRHVVITGGERSFDMDVDYRKGSGGTLTYQENLPPRTTVKDDTLFISNEDCYHATMLVPGPLLSISSRDVGLTINTRALAENAFVSSVSEEDQSYQSLSFYIESDMQKVSVEVRGNSANFFTTSGQHEQIDTLFLKAFGSEVNFVSGLRIEKLWLYADDESRLHLPGSLLSRSEITK